MDKDNEVRLWKDLKIITYLITLGTNFNNNYLIKFRIIIDTKVIIIN